MSDWVWSLLSSKLTGRTEDGFSNAVVTADIPDHTATSESPSVLHAESSVPILGHSADALLNVLDAVTSEILDGDVPADISKPVSEFLEEQFQNSDETDSPKIWTTMSRCLPTS